MEFETRAVHCGEDPIERRTHNPSVVLDSLDDEVRAIEGDSKQQLEKGIASLEGAKYGLCFCSGMAATASISMLVEDGDHVIIFDSVFHGTRTYLNIREEIGKVEVNFVDLRDASVLEKYMKPNTKMVWIETPCNPTMKIVDIAAVAETVKRQGKAFLVVDNTFLSPFFQNPLLHGADIVMHSLTKYISGHSDVLLGAAVTNREDLFEKLKNGAKTIGSLPSPLECYLCLRGLKTLHIRMERHSKNGLKIARFLEKHPYVERVFYPGLECHPQFALAKKQSRGSSGMVSFCIKGGVEEVKAFAARLRVFTLAVSLGSVGSLVDIPSLMTAGGKTKEEHKEMDITENLIRLSVGLEDAKDLIADLDQALRGN